MAPTHRRPADNGDFPWWLVAMGSCALGLATIIVVNDLYAQVFATVARGIGITLIVTVCAFSLATLMGLLVALAGLSDYLLLRQAARFYVELLRGIPILVLLFYIAFVGAPGFVWLYNSLAQPIFATGLLEPLQVRDVSLMWRAIFALAIGYSSFLAEIFRAGFQSVDPGQIEAAKSLGLKRGQRFRLIILPQAFRVILPPFSNDFVSMVKDSSLVSVLGVADVSQAGKIYASGSFRFFETYSIVAYIYLVLTIGLSLVLRGVERRLRQRQASR